MKISKSDIEKKYNFTKMEGKEGRFVIKDKSGKIVNDANGYGFTSIKNAINYILYKEAHPNISSYKTKVSELFKKYKDLDKIIDDLDIELWYLLKDEGKTITKVHYKNKLMKMIRESIPELNKELSDDSELKYSFLRKICK